MASNATFPMAVITGGGVQLIAEVINGALVVHHWGSPTSIEDPDALRVARTRALGHSEFDRQPWPGLFHEHSRGFLGAPMLEGHREGRDWSSKFHITSLESKSDSIRFVARDEDLRLELQGTIEIDDHGILRLNYRLKNEGERYTLNSLRYWLPLPDRARERMDFFGRWSNERQPQRAEIDLGLFSRETREGRSGHNFTIGLMAMQERADFQSGEVWSVALAHSGNSMHQIERSYEGQSWIGAGEILYPGEVTLESGESYHAPTLVATHSKTGLDGIASNHHRSLRSRNKHPKRPRPLTLNMWEAIYFAHDEAKVRDIVDVASEIGIERVVLDDGWFGSRRDDRSGLGDWIISKDVWPGGLRPIADYVRSKGMEFGLWFEGEMVNPDSDLYRKHPEWTLSVAGREQLLWRHELVLDLSNPAVFEHLFEKISGVIGEVGVDYIKWDHNRVLIDAGADGLPRYRAQVEAIYRFFDSLKAAHPGLEIESCASGGARIDLGMVEHVDRFWTSDNNDALSRQSIQRWSAQFIPPELLGTHIGPYPSHQTGRSTPLSMRAAMALFGHAGIEWDITTTSSEDRALLRSWASFYKEHRGWMHRGTMVRIDHSDHSAQLYGVVSDDRAKALFTYVQIIPASSSHPGDLLFRGLDRDRKYRVTPVFPAGKPHEMTRRSPEWFDGIEVKGSTLIDIGIKAPILEPENALLIELTAT
ncbi:MAG: alpha-galactosidase [Candidatus Nanopelagicaceae bacterium]